LVKGVLDLSVQAKPRADSEREELTNSTHEASLPQELLVLYERLGEVYQERPIWNELREEELWKELCFCILSSSVPYEMAESAVLQLSRKGLLEIDEDEGNMTKLIAFELSRPVYRPERKDGSLRVYRFPRKRAHDIAGARKYLYSENSGLTSLLAGSTLSSVRMSMVTKLPGLGLKEASHFLRNVRYTDSLAVLDSHVMSFLNLFVRPLQLNIGLTPRRYIELEALFVQFARALGLRPAVLDMAIWEYMRSR
jgi:N-glycosylase/DNA lyase